MIKIVELIVLVIKNKLSFNIILMLLLIGSIVLNLFKTPILKSVGLEDLSHEVYITSAVDLIDRKMDNVQAAQNMLHISNYTRLKNTLAKKKEDDKKKGKDKKEVLRADVKMLEIICNNGAYRASVFANNHDLSLIYTVRDFYDKFTHDCDEFLNTFSFNHTFS